jgi:hypothetical protein
MSQQGFGVGAGWVKATHVRAGLASICTLQFTSFPVFEESTSETSIVQSPAEFKLSKSLKSPKGVRTRVELADTQDSMRNGPSSSNTALRVVGEVEEVMHELNISVTVLPACEILIIRSDIFDAQ